MAKEAVTQILGQPSYCRLKVAGDGLSELLFYERTSGKSTIVLEFDTDARLVMSGTPTGVPSKPMNSPGVAKKTTQAEGRLKKGMSKQDVVSIMGTPSFSEMMMSGQGMSEQWLYEQKPGKPKTLLTFGPEGTLQDVDQN